MRRSNYLIIIIVIIYFLNIPGNIYAQMSDRDTLNVGVDPSIPPFQFIDNEELSGLNIDILNHIGKENNIKINYLLVNKDISLEKLLEGELDIVLGVRYDPNLSEKINYTENIVQSVISILAKTENHEEIQANLNSSYYLASVENNSIEEDFLKSIRRMQLLLIFTKTYFR